MKGFSEFSELNEVAISFGGKMYPKFNQIVILAGGSGVGKGFTLKKLMAIEGLKFDVDYLKELAMKSNKLAADVKEKTGYDIKKFDLRKPENVSTLHDIIKTIQLDTKDKSNKFRSIMAADPRRKPNIIFDVTLKGLGKLQEITRNVEKIGYEKENIHIVWVLNDVKVAIEQNSTRSRVVPKEILIDTHEGVSLTMNKIVNMGKDLNKYMDGDIFVAFNKEKIDTDLVKSGKGGMYFANKGKEREKYYVQIKKKGGSVISEKDLPEKLLKKIIEYTPDIKTWVN